MVKTAQETFWINAVKLERIYLSTTVHQAQGTCYLNRFKAMRGAFSRIFARLSLSAHERTATAPLPSLFAHARLSRCLNVCPSCFDNGTATMESRHGMQRLQMLILLSERGQSTSVSPTLNKRSPLPLPFVSNQSSRPMTDATSPLRKRARK